VFPRSESELLARLDVGSYLKAAKELWHEDGDCQDGWIVPLPNRKGSKSTKISISDVNAGLDERGDCTERGKAKFVSGSRGQEMGPERSFPLSINWFPGSITRGSNASNKGSDD